MKLTFKSRDWHNWMSVILAVPLLVIGLTSLFLAHKKELGLNDIDLTAAVAWLPGYRPATMKQAGPEVRASLAGADGREWIGTQNGLYVVADGRAQLVPELAGTQVRGLAQAPWGVVAATREGIWVERADGWRRAHKGDAWNASVRPDGSVAVAIKDMGLVTSRDGERWKPDPALAEALASLPRAEVPGERVSLAKLMIDLHTGKAFLGKEAEWIWIDLFGAVWVFLGFTGLYMWWRMQTKRRDAARNRAGAQGAVRA